VAAGDNEHVPRRGGTAIGEDDGELGFGEQRSIGGAEWAGAHCAYDSAF
jgi:hypothetical protein